MLVPVRTSFGLRQHIVVQRGMYQRKVHLNILNAVKIKLADVSSISPSSEQRWDCGLGMFNFPSLRD